MHINIKYQQVVVLAILMSMTGCASLLQVPDQRPTSLAVENAEFGDPPDRITAITWSERWLDKNLRDPKSRRVKWDEIYKMWVGAGQDSHLFCYGLYAKVNAKNGFGGYAGEKPYLFVFVGDIPLVTISPEEMKDRGSVWGFARDVKD